MCGVGCKASIECSVRTGTRGVKARGSALRGPPRPSVCGGMAHLIWGREAQARPSGALNKDEDSPHSKEEEDESSQRGSRKRQIMGRARLPPDIIAARPFACPYMAWVHRHGQVRKKKVRILNSDLDCPSRQIGEVIVCFSFWACANRRVLFSQNFHFLNEWFAQRATTSLLAWPASPFSLSPPGHGGVRCPAPGEDRTGLQAW